MHFQTNYYRENPNSNTSPYLSNEYYILKESLTALLDEFWKPIMTCPICKLSRTLRDKHESIIMNVDFDKSNGIWCKKKLFDLNLENQSHKVQ